MIVVSCSPSLRVGVSIVGGTEVFRFIRMDETLFFRVTGIRHSK